MELFFWFMACSFQLPLINFTFLNSLAPLILCDILFSSIPGQMGNMRALGTGLRREVMG